MEETVKRIPEEKKREIIRKEVEKKHLPKPRGILRFAWRWVRV